jgi:hypothetical protein
MKKIGTLYNNFFFEKMANFILKINFIFNVKILIDLKQIQTTI